MSVGALAPQIGPRWAPLGFDANVQRHLRNSVLMSMFYKSIGPEGMRLAL